MDLSKRVGFWPRVGATLLDLVFLLPFLGLFLGAMWYFDSKGKLTLPLEAVFGLMAEIGMLVYGGFEVFKAATPGKMVLGQRIVAQDGRTASPPALFKRYALKHAVDAFGLITVVVSSTVLEWIYNVAMISWLIACLLVLRASRQAPWDQVAKTIVVRKKDLEGVRGFHPLMAVPLNPVQPAESRQMP